MHEDLAPRRLGHDPSGAMDGLPEQVSVSFADLPVMDADPDVNPAIGVRGVVPLERALDRNRAPDRDLRRRKIHQKAVAEELGLVAPALLNVLSNYDLMGPKDLVCQLIASASAQPGRALDVRKQDRSGPPSGRLRHPGSSLL